MAEKGARDQKPSASTIKLLIAETACAMSLPLDEEVTVKEMGTTMYASILAAFRPERRMLLGELLALSLLTSDNAATDYLIDRIGIDLINRRAQDLGLSDTSLAIGFADEHLGADGLANITSAHDLAQLLERFYNKRDSSASYRTAWRALVNNLRNQRVPALLPDDVPVAHKTGTLPGIANDAAVVLAGHPDYILVVMTEHEQSNYEASRDEAYFSADLLKLMTKG